MIQTLNSGAFVNHNWLFSTINRFLRDSAVLADWMGGATEMIDRWSQLSVSAEEEMDVERRRDDFLQFVVSRSINIMSYIIKYKL